MRPLSPDTPIEVEEIWLGLIREKGPLWSLRRTVEMSARARRAAREAVRSAHPEALPPEQDRIYLVALYGDEAMAREVVALRAEQGYYDPEP